MIWNKEQIEAYLVFQDEAQQFFIDKIDSKESRTRQQEKTYYLIMNSIAKHLGYSVNEVKMYMLSGAFWTKKLKLSKTEIEVPVISRTSEFTKEQGIFFIDCLLTFCKLKQIPIQIETAEIKSLYETYS